VQLLFILCISISSISTSSSPNGSDRGLNEHSMCSNCNLGCVGLSCYEAQAHLLTLLSLLLNEASNSHSKPRCLGSA
jgi:hypothetical protein